MAAHFFLVICNVLNFLDYIRIFFLQMGIKTERKVHFMPTILLKLLIFCFLLLNVDGHFGWQITLQATTCFIFFQHVPCLFFASEFKTFFFFSLKKYFSNVNIFVNYVGTHYGTDSGLGGRSWVMSTFLKHSQKLLLMVLNNKCIKHLCGLIFLSYACAYYIQLKSSFFSF